MQTSFSAAQLADPDYASSNQVLRTCVHCGFCTATCPTFVLLGDELDSPRGRIYLIKDMLEAARPATAEVVRHVDRCLGCLACMTTCPSGVNYMHLVDHARAYIEETYTRPWHDRLLRGALARLLPNPALFRVALRAAWLARPFAPLLRGNAVLARRLRAMLALAPARLPPPGRSAQPVIHPAQGPRRGRVALLTGCAQTVLAPQINEATIRLLTRLGIEVVVARGVGCCGALTHHMGAHEPALAAARAAIAGWYAEIEGGGLDAVIINTSGCGTTVKEYGFMFRAEPEPWPARAAAVAAITMDITSYLERIGYEPTRPAPELRVAYHAACSLQHGQKITASPKNLLRKAGFEVVEPRDAHLCCGSAGTYNILQPEIAGRLKARKLETIAALDADLIAAGNIGCLTQLMGGIPTVHTVELLDWMAGGPVPKEVGKARGSAPGARQAQRARARRGLRPQTPNALRGLGALLLVVALGGAAPEDTGALLAALKAASTEQQAAALEQRLISAWHDQATPAVQILIEQAARKVAASHQKDALADADAAIVLQPDLADLWRRRAELRFATGDEDGAIADLAQAISREPRLVPAWASLSLFEEARHDNKRALAAWQKVLELDPKTAHGASRLDKLQRKVNGQPI